MARNALVIAAVALAAAGCAGMSRSSVSAEQPSASIADLSAVAGHWQGTMYETAGSLVSGSSAVDLTIAPDGTWRGTIAKTPASGHARLRNGRLVLQGTASEGPAQAFYLDLKGDDTRRWGQTVASFGGRDDRASVALTRTQS